MVKQEKTNPSITCATPLKRILLANTISAPLTHALPSSSTVNTNSSPCRLLTDTLPSAVEKITLLGIMWYLSTSCSVAWSADSSTEPMASKAELVGTKMVKSEMLRPVAEGLERPKSMASWAASRAAFMAK